MQLQHEFAACKAPHHQELLLLWTFASSRSIESPLLVRCVQTAQESNCEICYNLSACPVSCAKPLDAFVGHKSWTTNWIDSWHGNAALESVKNAWTWARHSPGMSHPSFCWKLLTKRLKPSQPVTRPALWSWRSIESKSQCLGDCTGFSFSCKQQPNSAAVQERLEQRHIIRNKLKKANTDWQPWFHSTLNLSWANQEARTLAGHGPRSQVDSLPKLQSIEAIGFQLMPCAKPTQLELQYVKSSPTVWDPWYLGAWVNLLWFYVNHVHAIPVRLHRGFGWVRSRAIAQVHTGPQPATLCVRNRSQKIQRSRQYTNPWAFSVLTMISNLSIVIALPVACGDKKHDS